MRLTRREPALVIVFSIITCGIYGIYWYVVTTDEIQASLREPDGSVSSGGLCFLFTILSCGIYSYYWYYKQGVRIAQLERENNIPERDNSTLYVILCFFGLGIIAEILMQSALNNVIDLSKRENYGN